MICQTLSPLSSHPRVVFELPAALWADRVFVVGDFNQVSPIPLQQADDGAWRAALDLLTGHQYHFHSLVNGEWRVEFQTDSLVISLINLL